MAKKHGSRQQKKIAKQKAKRAAKRSSLFERISKDPTIRLQRAEKWPVVQALVGSRLWADGIGHLVIARQESEGRLVCAVFLVDVYCLGVKNAFWDTGTNADLKDLIQKIEKVETLRAISPECLVKIIQGAVEYAQCLDFPPHPDYRHAAMLLEGIDPSTCPNKYTYGRDGRPFYFQGPNETNAQAMAIRKRVLEVGGHYVIRVPADTEIMEEDSDLDDEFDPFDEEDEDESDA